MPFAKLTQQNRHLFDSASASRSRLIKLLQPILAEEELLRTLEDWQASFVWQGLNQRKAV
ncbi:MAG: hypothetical protein Kow0088_22830 [Anaerolineales bacterium]